MKAAGIKREASFRPLDLRESGILFALIALWFVCAVFNPVFRDAGIYLSILRESAFVGTAAIGMTFCIISGDFDLSIASLLALLSIVTIELMGKVGLAGGILITIALGTVAGLFNGLLVAVVRIPAFIATLAMYFIYRALAFIVSDGNPVQFQVSWFIAIGNGNFLGLPLPFLIFAALALVATLALRKTVFGRHVLAIGNSKKASEVAGIGIVAVRIAIFGVVGAFTAGSAILLSSRLWSANPGMKYGFEFDVIAAVVLGGTSLSGGKGSVFNTLVAAIFFASLNTAMNMFHVDSYAQRVVIGIVLLFAFSMNGLRAAIEAAVRSAKAARSAKAKKISEGA